MTIATQPAPLVVASGPTSTAAVRGDPVAPEFLVSLNTCTPKEWVDSHVDPKKGPVVQWILEHVAARLGSSLDPIWEGPDGHDPEWEPRPNGSTADAERIRADEEWARWCTELMAGTVYGSSNKYGGAFEDHTFYAAFNDPSNPVVPARMACQQLCTYAYYSRGLSYDQVASESKASRGVSAGPNGLLTRLFADGWDGNGKYANLDEAFGRSSPIGPGSILCFSPPTDPTATKPRQDPGSHVAYVLRTAPGVLSVQLMDTGAIVSSRPRSKTGSVPLAVPAQFSGMNMDDQLFRGNVRVARPAGVRCVGMGVLSPIDPATIRKGVAAARRARPLGTARLAIFERHAGAVKPEHIRYVSPLVLMHDRSSDANFYSSRFLWSLRMTPGYGNLEVLWQLSHPVGEVALRMMRADRTASLADSWGTSGVHLDAFLYMSNDELGRSRLRARMTLKATKVEGKVKQEEVFEGDISRYRAVLAAMRKTRPQQHLVAAEGAVVPPPYFEPW